ncbi:hypothetical protein FKM82_008281 [Ascaphus truei]
MCYTTLPELFIYYSLIEDGLTVVYHSCSLSLNEDLLLFNWSFCSSEHTEGRLVTTGLFVLKKESFISACMGKTIHREDE